MNIGAEIEERAAIINRAAKGWKLHLNEDGSVLDRWSIIRTDGLFDVPHTNRDAIEWVVNLAWSEDPLGLLALDFLRAHAPQSYVTAINIAHGNT